MSTEATSKSRNRQRDDQPLDLVPTFAAPETPSTSLSSTSSSDGPSTPDLERIAEGLRQPDQTQSPRRSFLPRRNPGASLHDSPPPDRTSTSDTGGERKTQMSDTEATALVIGIIGLAGTAAAFGVRWLLKRKLRKPNKRERRNIAAPLAQILLRHVDMIKLGPDIADGLEAAAAVGDYAGNGPLLLELGPDIDANVPPSEEE